MLFNPVFLYLANYISSDTLFLSLSIIWFTILLWIIYSPNIKLIIFHALILFLAFTIRYNALYYPLISFVAFLLYKKKIITKIIGLIFSILIVYSFIQYNREKYFELSGYKQFTPFSGWQMANNAMYAYKFVPNKEVKKVPLKFKELDKMIRDYFDSTRNNPNHPEEKLIASTVYMWTPTAPLNLYMNKKLNIDSLDKSELKHWSTIAPIYKEYGVFIIRNYPWTFTRYYLIPNALKYYVPPIEFLGQYSTGKDVVHPIAQRWFQYNSNKLTTIFKDFKVNVLNYFPILVGIMNIIFLMGILSFLLLNGLRKCNFLKNSIFLITLLWIANFIFSVFASPIALRFQLFPILVMITFTFLFIEYLLKEALIPKN
ncbi:hypothetical protein [Chitinophaga sp. LS1]|uniref:hypothetical protein n=1 Tax=Chitinophaga sp. LS1 TaxID=3051176 RepID=UPI002AABAFDF|nr:hypothetical protein [Chitinophaga sp. LS1]WPV67814.1 hypothetical protein QQL36_03615 [Chitinophaga sp. LS1]